MLLRLWYAAVMSPLSMVSLAEMAAMQVNAFVSETLCLPGMTLPGNSAVALMLLLLNSRKCEQSFLCLNSAGSRLPCDLCQGYTLDLKSHAAPESASDFMSGQSGIPGPSLLGSTYLAVQVSRRQILAAQWDIKLLCRCNYQRGVACMVMPCEQIYLGAGRNTPWPAVKVNPVHSVRSRNMVHARGSGRVDIKKT